MRLRRWARQKIDVLLVKLFLVEVFLDVDEYFAHAGLLAGGPGERVAVRSSVVDVHIDVKLLPFSDETWVEPCDGGEFVPEIIRFRVFRDVLRGGSGALGDLRDQALLHARLDGNIHGGEDHARPVRVEHGMRGFRIHPEIEFAPWTEVEFRVVRIGINAAAHDDQLLRELGEVRVQSDGQGEVGHGSGSVDGDFVGELMNHPDHEMRSVFRRSLAGGSTFGHRWNFVRTVHGVMAREIPGALVDDLAVKRFPLSDVLLGIDERKNGARNHRNVRAANDFEQTQGVLYFLVPPGVAGEYGDAKNIGLRRIDQSEDGLHVRSTGSGAVLINDHFAFGLGYTDGGE